jgi:hypothetical protein
MRSFWHLVMAAVLCASWIDGVALADETYSLYGKVVNSVDGTPIRSALVQLNGPTKVSALTGNDGGFVFSKLAAGDFVVSARKPGYFASEIGEPLGAVEARVQVNARTQELSLPLIPEGILYGKIVDEKGEPIEGLEVLAKPKYGRAAPGNAGFEHTATTNENGEYRMAELQPGSYYLIEARKTAQGEGEMSWAVRRLGTGIPINFYPGALEAAQAATIRVLPGSSQKVDWRIPHQPVYQIAGRVRVKGDARNVLIMLMSFYNEQPFGMVPPEADGSFVFSGVAPGRYVVAAFQPENQEQYQGENQVAQNPQMGVKLITVNENLQNVILQMFPETQKPIHFKEEYSHKAAAPAGTELTDQSAPANVSFLRADLPEAVTFLLSERPAEWNNEKKELRVALEPGTYRIDVNAPQKIYVASAMSGGTDLLKEDLVVGPEESLEPIELVLRDDSASLTGTVHLDGKGTQGRVVLVAENAPRQAVIAAAAADGRFQFDNLAPGRYYLLALKNGIELDLQDQGTLRRIQGLGQSVELDPDATARVEPELKKWDE